MALKANVKKEKQMLKTPLFMPFFVAVKAELMVYLHFE
jgi:hypothetical protein